MLSFLSLLIPTKDQMASYIRTGFKWAGSALIARGVTVSPDLSSAVAGPEAIQVYTGIAMAIFPVIIDRLVHSDAGKLKAASSLAMGPDPQIRTIIALPTAEPAIVALAKDANVPGVQPAATSAFIPAKGCRS